MDFHMIIFVFCFHMKGDSFAMQMIVIWFFAEKSLSEWHRLQNDIQWPTFFFFFFLPRKNYGMNELYERWMHTIFEKCLLTENKL